MFQQVRQSLDYETSRFLEQQIVSDSKRTKITFSQIRTIKGQFDDVSTSDNNDLFVFKENGQEEVLNISENGKEIKKQSRSKRGRETCFSH